MNLTDYQKTVVAMFGKCEHGFCGACTTCRVMDLIHQVWTSGQHSGASSSVERTSKKCLYGEWVLSDQVIETLEDYILSIAPEGLFSCRGDANLFLREQVEAMREWAEAKGERKVNWTMAMKGWIRRSLKGSRWRPSGGRSALPSKVSRAEAEHEETFLAAMALNSPKEPPSPCRISSGTGSRKTPPGSRSSSQTQLKFH